MKEQSNLELRIEMNGNPPPSADFKWSHLPMSTTVSSEQLYPFVYSSTYSLHNINGSYCGRNLQVMVKNNIGSSSSKNINVTVICKLCINIICLSLKYLCIVLVIYLSPQL